ncbi:hypothetical protein [Aliirhizobium cellulosilyticum]|uniref:Uncharacterized protein n=1 Tax=Aliirhizobium cellulosilyticum TaxID=393664 RepID=A0A7W6TFC7_9HYPH|nr:hypothetical protein [Rhizobium cellulosilyticum]MBB4349469.1 hypothetical protein [Rhizobium cellulosilyticum]MBB4412309.1 hypothetical protein [Rhizobium cellulosilyticum]MBB4446940.1 hypothetical protein [Rhizobium cellulosilyticum]
MYYEWNARKARRVYVGKILIAWMAVIAASALPIVMAVNALTF